MKKRKLDWRTVTEWVFALLFVVGLAFLIRSQINVGPRVIETNTLSLEDQGMVLGQYYACIKVTSYLHPDSIDKIRKWCVANILHEYQQGNNFEHRVELLPPEARGEYEDMKIILIDPEALPEEYADMYQIAEELVNRRPFESSSE